AGSSICAATKRCTASASNAVPGCSRSRQFAILRKTPRGRTSQPRGVLFVAPRCPVARLGVELDRGIGCHVHPHVYVRRTAEVPDEAGAFQAPAIPDLIVAQVAVAVESQRALVQTALGLEARQHFVFVGLAIR